MFRRGDFVKASRDAERLWFEVKDVTAAGLVCRLDNHPTAGSLKYGDEVVLSAAEIVDSIRVTRH